MSLTPEQRKAAGFPLLPDVVSSPPIPPRLTQAELDAAVEALKADSANVSAGLPAAPLAGLLTGNARLRKRAYVTFAVASLLISLGPDLVTFSIITGASVTPFVAWVSFSSSALLKIGTAFGLVAASNTR